MKRLNISLAMSILFTALMTSFAACGDDDDPQEPSPKVTINLRSCSIAEGAEYNAADLKEVTLSYNNVVAVSPSANITLRQNSATALNGTKCTARSSAATAMDVVVTLPALEEGTSYTLDIPAGSIVSKTDATASAPAFTISFTTKAKAQLVNANISATPVTATSESAKKLYTFFYDNYGKKVVSSVMADVNWNHRIADKVQKLTGKCPAMNCYDFIHIYVPNQGSNGWIDYTDITPVTEWVNAGGIVQLMWHFNVPLTETTEMKTNGSGVTCSPDKTTFKASNALKDGTWENKWFYEQMDKVVSVILQLQQAGIAATWRPFHEAAGNAMLKSGAAWGKSWFWWGYDGADTFKKLWVAMYDYFKQKGVENLIWIWTTQNYNGNSSIFNQDADWYPGDAYCDMVARDLYGSNAAQNAQEFTEIQAAYPNKMVVLGECGRGDNGEQGLIGDCWTQGARWGHFMVWYQGGQGSTDTMCSDDWWRSVMSNENVITRDLVK